jgi:dolichol-phosphate mannosyltransferase
MVVPALDEAEGAAAFLARYRDYARLHPDVDFELILVDDGSTDDTAEAFAELATDRDRLTVVELSRNFGAHYAATAGIAQARGDCAVLYGADLQEPVSLLESLLHRWRAGYDVVWGVRRSRVEGSPPYRFLAHAFSHLFARYAGLGEYPAEGPSGMLVDRRVIDELVRLRERHRNLLALVAWLGFAQTRVEFDLEPRAHGRSRWSRRSMVALAVDSMIQFSSLPLRLSVLAGLAVAGLGLLYAAVLVVRALAGVSTPSGWPTVTVIVLILGGVQLVVVGVAGEYLWRAVEETRGRPLYVVRSVRTVGRQGLDARRPAVPGPTAPAVGPEERGRR